MSGYASDGLPKWYYEVIEDPYVMSLMKINVFNTLTDHYYPGIRLREVCDLADISCLFDNEVSDFIEEWKEERGIKV